MTKIFNSALKIKGGGREGGTCEVLRPCHPRKIWNVHLVQALAGGAYRFGVGARLNISWCILILNKGEITHLVVNMDLE